MNVRILPTVPLAIALYLQPFPLYFQVIHSGIVDALAVLFLEGGIISTYLFFVRLVGPAEDKGVLIRKHFLDFVLSVFLLTGQSESERVTAAENTTANYANSAIKEIGILLRRQVCVSILYCRVLYSMYCKYCIFTVLEELHCKYCTISTVLYVLNVSIVLESLYCECCIVSIVL